MKLYSYSDELQMFTGATWTAVRFFFGGVLLGSILLCGAIVWYISIGTSVGHRSSVALIAENQVLRQHVAGMTFQVSSLESGSVQMFEQASEFRSLLRRRSIVVDTVTDRMHVVPKFTFQVVIPEKTGPLQ